MSYPFHRSQNLLDYSTVSIWNIYKCNIYMCRPRQKPCFALNTIDPTDLFFFHEPPRQVDNFCRHFCWLGNFLKEMTLNIVKGFLPPLISCCNNGAVPLSDFFNMCFWVLCLFFFSKCILWLIVRPQVKTPPGAHIIQYNSVCVLTVKHVKLQWPLAKIGLHHISINLHAHKFI